MALLNTKFIDSDYYTNTYQTAFSTKWLALTDEEHNRFIGLAGLRVKSLADRPFVDLEDLEQEQAEGIQLAVCRLLDYWMEYGLDLNRISGSVSLGSYSMSQTVPLDPDYIPKHVFDALQAVGLYTPVGFISDEAYRVDDEREVTYGVRTKDLTRVKDIELEKTDAQRDPNHGNKGLSIPTSALVDEKIRDAKMSPFNIRGTYEVQAALPTGPTLDFLFTTAGITLTDGTVLTPTNTARNDAIKVISTGSGKVEIADYDGSNWTIDTSGDSLETQVDENTASLSVLNGLTQNRAIKAVEGDTRYIKVDGTNSMNAVGTIGSDNTNTEVATKGAVLNEITSQVATLPTQADVDNKQDSTLSAPIDGATTVEDSLSRTNSKADLLGIKKVLQYDTTGFVDEEVDLKDADQRLISEQKLDSELRTYQTRALIAPIDSENSVEGALRKTNIIANSAQTTGNDYLNNKADFLRIQDVQASIDVSTDITMTEDGKDVVADLSTLPQPSIDLINSFVNDSLVIIRVDHTNGIDDTEYGRDSWNNAMGTANVILGKAVSIKSTWTADGVTPEVREFRMSGLGQADRNSFINDYHITLLSQASGTAGAAIDQIARNEAINAQSLATTAINDAQQAKQDASDAVATANKNKDEIVVLDAKDTSQDNDIATLQTRATAIETKNTSQDTEITNLNSAIGKKQNSTISTYIGTAHTVEDALNETRQKADNNEADIKEVINNGKIISDDNARQLTLPNVHGTVLTDKDISGYKEFKLDNNQWYEIQSTGDGEYLLHFESGLAKAWIPFLNNKPDLARANWSTTSTADLKIGTNSNGDFCVKSINGDGKLWLNTEGYQTDKFSVLQENGTVNEILTRTSAMSAVKDLTNLVTEDDIYNAITGGNEVVIANLDYSGTGTGGALPWLLFCSGKDSTRVVATGFRRSAGTTSDEDQLPFMTWTEFRKGVHTKPVEKEPVPHSSSQPATKKYVDRAVAGASGESWLDITSFYKTRNWHDGDVGKMIRITTGNDVYSLTGYITKASGGLTATDVKLYEGSGGSDVRDMVWVFWRANRRNGEVSSSTNDSQSANLIYHTIDKFEIKE